MAESNHRGIRGDIGGLLLLAVATDGGCWDTSPGSWRAASGGGTWLWRPCHSRRQVARGGTKIWAYLSHTYIHTYIQAENDGGHNSAESHSRRHAMTSWWGWMLGRLYLGNSPRRDREWNYTHGSKDLASLAFWWSRHFKHEGDLP
jgi:hypothetical protein